MANTPVDCLKIPKKLQYFVIINLAYMQIKPKIFNFLFIINRKSGEKSR